MSEVDHVQTVMYKHLSNHGCVRTTNKQFQSGRTSTDHLCPCVLVSKPGVIGDVANCNATGIFVSKRNTITILISFARKLGLTDKM